VAIKPDVLLFLFIYISFVRRIKGGAEGVTVDVLRGSGRDLGRGELAVSYSN
jgi:hypothetical protein